MKFLVKSRFEEETIELTAVEFESARRAYMVNQNVLALEEKYFLILQNFGEFERALHELALVGLIFGAKKWTEHVNDIQAVNGRLLNLLSSTKAYLDQVPQHLNKMFGDACEQSTSFVKSTNDEFEASFGYRVMSAVRNHVQHNDFPVRWVQIGGQWEMDGEIKKLCRHHATALISVTDLVENAKIRSATRTELSDTGKAQLNVKLIVRQYLSSMARLHIRLRESVARDATLNEEVVRNMINRVDEVFTRKHSSYEAMILNDDGSVAETVPVFVENVDRRKYLVEHCPVITNMEAHCISSEI